MGNPELLVSLFYLVNAPEELPLQDQGLYVAGVLLKALFDLSKGQLLVAGPDIGQCPEVDELDIVILNQVQGIVAVPFLDQREALHEVELVELLFPLSHGCRVLET